jgi:hypothetical protein
LHSLHSLRRLGAVALGLALSATMPVVTAGPANALTGPIAFGNTGDIPIIGNWDGVGADDIGVYRPGNGRFYRYGSASAGVAFGNIGDVPITGNWFVTSASSDADQIGVYRPSNQTFYLSEYDGGPAPHEPSSLVRFGNPGDVPIKGRWDGGSYDDLGVYRPSNSTFYFNFGRGNVSFGAPGDIPITGDWIGDGRDRVGVYRPSNGHFYREGFASQGTPFGNIGDKPVIGDWDNDGVDEIGVYRPSNHTFYPDLQA